MRVLVLGYGNRYRSPLCAGLIQDLRPEWEVRSAGVSSPQGLVDHYIKRLTAGAAQRMGFALREHSPTLVNVTIVGWANWIVYLDDEVLTDLPSYVTVDTRFVCLGEFAGRLELPRLNSVIKSGEVFYLMRRATVNLVRALDERAECDYTNHGHLGFWQ